MAKQMLILETILAVQDHPLWPPTWARGLGDVKLAILLYDPGGLPCVRGIPACPFREALSPLCGFRAVQSGLPRAEGLTHGVFVL